MGFGCGVWSEPEGEPEVAEAEAGEEGLRSREPHRPQLLPWPLERAAVVGTADFLFAIYPCRYIDTHSLP